MIDLAHTFPADDLIQLLNSAAWILETSLTCIFFLTTSSFQTPGKDGQILTKFQKILKDSCSLQNLLQRF